MNRASFLSIRTIALVVIGLGFMLSGCSSEQAQMDLIKSNERQNDELRFGPIYPVQAISDPVVAQAVKSAQTTGAPIVSAEIRGFLVDWIINETSGTSIREFVVMKDGSLYRDSEKRPRPYGAFSKGAPTRLAPESQQEAQSRKDALATAHLSVTKMDSAFASIVPTIYFYIVRINRKDGSSADLLRGREIELYKVEDH